MKNFKKYILSVLALGVLLSGLLYAEIGSGKDSEKSRGLQKPTIGATGKFDGNRIDNDFENNGMIVSHNISGRSGMSWPVGNNTQTVFASGIWIGGLIGNVPHVSAGEYGGEFSGGPWGSDPGDPYHTIYKVNKADLADPIANPHFQNWPTDFGAPWVDNDGNGIYEPLPNGPDHPEFIGDQVIYMVMNDGDPTQHSIFQTNPMGIEMQTTMFGFDRPDAFGDMMFVKTILINKGEETIKDTYIGLWSDPDLGDAGDDFVGCVPDLGLGICYNDGVDHNFAGYSGGTPAVGYDFFQGPIVPAPGETALVSGKVIPDYKNLSMTSFSKYININDPVWSDPNSADEAYNLMKGFMKSGAPFADNLTGGTPFVHPGDPNLDTGPTDQVYVDSDVHPSGDRRFLMNAGPFTMNPGDQQEVVFAVFHAAAGTALESYSYLKEVDKIAQLAYDTQFALPPSPPAPGVTVTTFEDEILLTWTNAAETYSAVDVIDKDPVTGDNTKYAFEGYNVWQYETASGSGAKKLLATYDLNNGITEIYDDVFDATYGEIINRRVQFGSDSGVKRSIVINKDGLNNNIPLKTNRVYYYSVNAYGYNEFGIPKTLESSAKIMAIRPQIANTWEATDETGLYGTVINAEHTAGPSDGVAKATIINKTHLTGDDYEMFFTEEKYYRDVDGIWKNVNTAGKEGLAKILDCGGSVITVAALASANIGTYDLTFTFDMDCGSNWVDGILLDFPAGVVINSWDPLGDCSYPDDGQNCVNMDGTYDAATNAILWGDDARSTFGAIEGGHTWKVNVQPTGFPINVGYTVYDDVYDGTQVDAIGTASATELGYDYKTIEGWYVRNLNTGQIVSPHTTIQSGFAEDNIVNGVFVPAHTAGNNAGPMAEGLQFAVDGPALGIKSVSETDVNDVLLDPRVGLIPSASLGTTGYILMSRHDAKTGWAGRTMDRFGYWGMDDVIIDFSEQSLCFSYSDGKIIIDPATGLPARAPFSVYRVIFPSGERMRLFAGWYEVDGDNAWSVQGAWTEDNWGKAFYEPIFGWQGYDWDGTEVAYDPADDATHVAYGGLPAGAAWGTSAGQWPYPFLTETILVTYTATATPPWGNRIWIATNKANTSADKFKVTTTGFGGVAKAYDPEVIKAWPNPYFGYNPEERDPIEQIVNFTHLPESGNCTIRIFNIAGVPVRTINHTNGTQFETWDLKNNFRIPVASGMYIAVVETDSGSKVLKLAIIQPEQRLDVY